LLQLSTVHATPSSQPPPHEIIPPQPSDTVPHSNPPGHFVSGVHPHASGSPPPPQVSGASHIPHETVAQPLLMLPHVLPWAAHEVFGVQPPQTLSSPPPPHD
jgi:hypothetical protein